MRLPKSVVSFKILVSTLLTIIAAFQVEATWKGSDGTGVRHLQVRNLPSKSNQSLTKTTNSPPPPPIQCGLLFFADALGNGHSVCKNFGGMFYDCLTDSCHVARSENSPTLLGNLIYKNCQSYIGDLGRSGLDTTSVDVVAVHYISYYNVEQLSPPIGAVAEWPERVDVVGYNASLSDREVAYARNYSCPLKVVANTVRPWCFNYSLTNFAAT
ncbi:hypothetical protein CROQUDRAFT_714945 [Cronartium quercuum f. sp. fusiforme G11]|uniref:Uncharacterized protein n=1 Tax=Cronartium quercuum f. sp. fusiforme G11 TaxID=708437 RepID=A0A9P6NKH2_9BASI|nr:hypothetical protein CROQUDRAFT_714945 [Cronartium quercuum f. sp. fusiforme G11]